MRVRITGYPARFPWMGDLVGRIGVAEEAVPLHGGKVAALRVSGLPGGNFWISQAYCEEVAEEEEGAA